MIGYANAMVQEELRFGVPRMNAENADKNRNGFLYPRNLRSSAAVFYGSGGAGLSVPRSRLKIDEGTHSGMLSAFAARTPINSITPATVRGPLQSQSGRTMSVGW